MAKVGPSPSSSSSVVFVDTDLDTHLAILVNPDDTVANLKGKIRAEHAVCFPDIGEIVVKAIKVRRKSLYYHLSDSMIIKFAFVGIKDIWSVLLDIAPTFQKEADKLISSGSGRQPENLHMEQGRIHSSQENQALPNVSNSQSKTLHTSPKGVDVTTLLNVTCNDLNDTVSTPKLDKSLDLGVPEMEKIVAESNLVVGSDSLGTANVGISVGASKKEKSKKRVRLPQNDHMLDSKSHSPSPSTNKKRRSKEKGGSLKDPIENQLKGDGDKSFLKHENNLPIDIKQKKTNKQSKFDGEAPKMQVDKSIDKTNSTLQQTSEKSEAAEKSNDKKSKPKGKRSVKIQLPEVSEISPGFQSTEHSKGKKEAIDVQSNFTQSSNPKRVPPSMTHRNSGRNKKAKLTASLSPVDPVENLISEKTGEENTVGLEKAQEASGLETFDGSIQEGSQDVTKAKDQAEQPKSDTGEVDSSKASDPDGNQIESTQGLHSGNTETEKTNMEKPKRKKRLNASPLDSTTNLVKPSVDKKTIRKKKVQDIESAQTHQKNAKKSTNVSEVKLQDKSSDPRSKSNDEKSDHLNGKKPIQSGSKLQSLADNEVKGLKVSANDVSHDLAASDNASKGDAPIQGKRHRVAVRKVPSTRSGKDLNKSDEEKMPVAPPVSDFNVAESRDKFEVKNGEDLMKDDAVCSSMFSDLGFESTEHHKDQKKTNDAQSNLTQSSSPKGMPITASQSENKDSERQPLDVIPEIRPELAAP